ncbi:hypothetical protein V5T82_08860 [Magnetovibrio sp. PR-2]|uniref:hypothetical protein n=1 Tax=Magnetovibrio sp. PR-2 TaxID=3120356 RepID=UPI002FCE54C6
MDFDAPALFGTVLVDATWDNPNFWYRFSLLRGALGLHKSKEVGIVGPWNINSSIKSLKNLGIRTVERNVGSPKRRHVTEAAEILAGIKSQEDFLSVKLPYDLPADVTLYDGVLARQKKETVDLDDPMLVDYVAEAISTFERNHRLLVEHKPSLVILSHSANFFAASLAVLACQMGIQVIQHNGDYGVLRFSKIRDPKDIYDFYDTISIDDIHKLSNEKQTQLLQLGAQYIKDRLGGKTNDYGAQLSYNKRDELIDKAAICKHFGWSEDKPIVGIYASNWFDFPHTVGMSHFTDFYDWILETYRVAVDTPEIQWLFKSHPCDAWYGGVTLEDVLDGTSAPNIRLANTKWNGRTMIDSIDAFVTYHGTIAIEAAVCRKPVMVADRGWYHHGGFAKWPSSREDYLGALKTHWWTEIDRDQAAQNASMFAGMFYCVSDEDKEIQMVEDIHKDIIYKTLPTFLSEGKETLIKEMQLIRNWYVSDSPYFHPYKMSQVG